MTPADMGVVLTAIGAYDGRKISPIDVVAWHRAVGDLDREDSLEAVVRHHGHTTDWMKPAHLRQLVTDIRNERAAAKQHEIRALPSRFEPDPSRDERIERGVQAGVHELAAKWAMPDEDNAVHDAIHEAALHRARRERKGRQATPPRPRRTGGPGIQLEKVTKPPEWADDTARERASIDTLHNAGRHCGRHHCPRCTALASVAGKDQA